MWVRAVVVSGAVPMFFAGRKPDDVAGANFFQPGSPQRCARPQPAVTMRGLAERVGVPRGPGAPEFERDTGTGRARRKQGPETTGQSAPCP